jgi:hypothetical protein
MHQPNVQRRPPTPQACSHRCRGTEVSPLGLLDDRQDDVSLTAFGALLFDELEHSLPLAGGSNRGSHVAPPRRTLAKGGHIEVAVEREGERPRDRGRRQEQHIGCRSLADQRGALLDAEPVLLVDHHQAQTLERRGLLQQGVRADDESGLAGGKPLSHRGLFR